MYTAKSSEDNVRKQTDTGRRSFMWKVGAGMSAVLAATVTAVAKPVIGSDKKINSSVDSLSRQVALLQNEKSIRELHKTFEDMLDNMMYSEVLKMFTDNAVVIFNGGVFKGRHGLERLFCGNFSSGMTGRRMDQAPGFQLKPEQQQDMVEIAPDQKSAKAGFTYSIQVGAPVESDSLIVKMSRLHGEGIMKWWEGGTYEVYYTRDISNNSWKMNRLEYRVLSAADYRPGKQTAKPITIHPFSKVFPADSNGPDRLVVQEKEKGIV
jgi:hypothetical protein